MKKKKKNQELPPKEDLSVVVAEDPNLQTLQLRGDVLKDVNSADGGPKPKRSNLKSFIINSLRRATYRWPPRGDALKCSRKEKGLYECAHCKEFFKNKEICLDHIVPVVDPKTGFTTWDDYIEKMFPEKEGFQVLCRRCHDVKTGLEDEMRKYYNKKRKVNKNE
jgi:5-methylcytosine-specific restriction endonuclease McrA